MSSQTPSVSVAFDPHGRADVAALNAWIRQDDAGRGFCIETTPFTPPLLLALCHSVIAPLFTDREVSKKWADDPLLLAAEVRRLQLLAYSARALVSEQGLGGALIHLRDNAGYTIYSTGRAADYFDGVVQFIACHEAAHAYVRQFDRPLHTNTDAESRAFEVLADLVATSWLYQRLIVGTPDTPEYRRHRGARSHRHAVLLNVHYVLQIQLAFVAFVGLGEIIRTKAPATLKGGPTHPHSITRYFIQQIHLMTLVETNFSGLLGKKALKVAASWWNSSMTALHLAGLIPGDTRSVLTADSEYAPVRRAGELAVELDIPELRKAAPFFQAFSAAPLIAVAVERENHGATRVE